MKKLLVLTLVMAMASAASAGTVSFKVDPADFCYGGYDAGEEITINVIADVEIGSFGLDIAANYGAVVGTGTEIPPGSGCDAGTVNAAFNVLPNAGLVVNSGGVLLTGAKGGIYTVEDPPLPADEIIYSFTFEMPDLPDSVLVTIDDTGFVSFLYGAENISDVEALVIHTPEPITIALLGLGGLFLRRRK